MLCITICGGGAGAVSVDAVYSEARPLAMAIYNIVFVVIVAAVVVLGIETAANVRNVTVSNNAYNTLPPVGHSFLYSPPRVCSSCS